MDIAAMSIMMNQTKVQQQASLSVTKLAMGVNATNGDFITSLANGANKSMELSVQPNLGSALDVQA